MPGWNDPRRKPIQEGTIFGRLTVIGQARTKKNKTASICSCICGKSTTVENTSLRMGITKSCSCLAVEKTIARSTKHFHCVKIISKTYIAWSSMNYRCGSSPNIKCFKDYYGRGIRICERWRKYKNFLQDMGEKPAGTTLDRKNNNGNYEPGNCRWASMNEQAGNRRDSRIVTVNGITACLAEHGRRIGLNKNTIYARLRNGWSMNEALTTKKLTPSS